jgi:phage terminase large subunit-like protein
MTGGRSHMNQRAIENFEGLIRNGDATHDGSFGLTNHVLNARRRIKANKLTLSKSNDYSSDKIDGCVAAVLAMQCALDAIAKGVKTSGQTAGRIR